MKLDLIVLCGVRDKDAQELAFSEGRSKVHWPDGKHNINPPERTHSEAVDLCPHPAPVIWDSKETTARFYILAGAVLQAAAEEGIVLRWGGDWDGDGDLKDQSFNDLGHFERKR